MTVGYEVGSKVGSRYAGSFLTGYSTTCGAGTVTCRLTHAYPDGAAPYFTVLAPAHRGAELRQWAEVKAAAAEAVLAAGGTITHHHAVGRDHVPWIAAETGEAGLADATVPLNEMADEMLARL